MRHKWMGFVLLLTLAACGDTQDTPPDDTPGAPNANTTEPDATPEQALPASPTLYMKIDASGTANLSKLDQPDALAVSGVFSGSDPVVVDAALSKVRHAFVTALRSNAIERNEHGEPNVTLALTVDSATSWKYVQWAVQFGADPAVAIRNIDFNDPRGGVSLPIQLPADRMGMAVEETLEIVDGKPVSSGPPKIAEVKVKVFRRGLHEDASERYTLIKLGNTHNFPLPKGTEANQDDEYWTQMRKLRDAIAAQKKAIDAKQFVLAAPPPKGGSVPYFDVFRILRMARDLKFDAILLEGKALPLPR